MQAFDALNRLVSVQDADYGVTAYDYDARDNLIEVTDPNSLVTSYEYDGLDNLIEQTSPDTGITRMTMTRRGTALSRPMRAMSRSNTTTMP